MSSLDLEKRINELSASRATPDWLYAMPLNSIVRAGEFSDFNAVRVFIGGGVISLDLHLLNMCTQANDLTVLYRGPILSAKYKPLAEVNHHIATPNPDHIVTVVSNDFPGAKRGGREGYIARWATFD